MLLPRHPIREFVSGDDGYGGNGGDSTDPQSCHHSVRREHSDVAIKAASHRLRDSARPDHSHHVLCRRYPGCIQNDRHTKDVDERTREREREREISPADLNYNEIIMIISN